jgi:acyl CoA:acetate/3-ketoacid CoA transferase beta subunit
VTPQGFQLREHAPGWTPEEIQELTEARLNIADDLREFRLRD